MYQTDRSSRRELLAHHRQKKLPKSTSRHSPNKKGSKPRNEIKLPAKENSHEDYTRFKINGKEIDAPFSRISKIEIKPRHNSSTLPIQFSPTPFFPVTENTQGPSLKFPNTQPFGSDTFALENDRFKTGIYE